MISELYTYVYNKLWENFIKRSRSTLHILLPLPFPLDLLWVLQQFGVRHASIDVVVCLLHIVDCVDYWQTRKWSEFVYIVVKIFQSLNIVIVDKIISWWWLYWDYRIVKIIIYLIFASKIVEFSCNLNFGFLLLYTFEKTIQFFSIS